MIHNPKGTSDKMLFNQTKRPSERQIMHCQTPVYGILHFGLNTYVNKEWGYGDTPPEVLKPANFDPDQIAAACKNGGLDGLVIVCKHHDGFCLWPTQTTEYSVRNTKWNRDYVGELSGALRRHGVKVGFYVSPWDRNCAAYGTAEYLEIFKSQLREVLTNYGEAFEVWFDGANGGDGYYGGTRGKRTVDLDSYYDWEDIWSMVRELQPGATIFSDVGPDLRWVGNEKGFAARDSRAAFTPVPLNGVLSPGRLDYSNSPAGNFDGIYYIPPECDFPLRPGWFYHENENDRQKSVAELIEIYESSVGQGGFMNIGVVINEEGVMPEADVRRLAEFKAARESLYANTVFLNDALPLTDGEGPVALKPGAVFNFIELKEPLCDGEQVTDWALEAEIDGAWQQICGGKSIGINRICRFDEVRAGAVRIKAGKAGRLSVRICLAPDFSRKSVSVLPENYRPMDKVKITGLELVAELPETLEISGIVFTPDQECIGGTPVGCGIAALVNGAWRHVADAEFSNVRANPIPQIVEFPATKASTVKLTATRLLDGGGEISLKEFGILEKK